MMVILISNLIDVVIGSWTGWSSWQSLITSRLSKTVFGQLVESAGYIVISSVWVATHWCLEEETLTLVPLSHSCTGYLFVVKPICDIGILTWAWSQPLTFSAFNRFLDRACHRVWELLEAINSWVSCFILAGTWLGCHFEGRRSHAVRYKFRIDFTTTSCRPRWPPVLRHGQRVTSRTWSFLAEIFKTLRFALWPCWYFVSFASFVGGDKRVPIRSRYVLVDLVIYELRLAFISAHRVGGWEPNRHIFKVFI